MSFGAERSAQPPPEDAQPCQMLLLAPISASGALELCYLGESPVGGHETGPRVAVEPYRPVGECAPGSASRSAGASTGWEASAGGGGSGGGADERGEPSGPARRSKAGALADAEKDERRKARNRRSNKNFRERQKNLIAALEEESRALRESIHRLETRNEKLRRENSVLKLCQERMGLSDEGGALARLMPDPTHGDTRR